MHTCTKTCACVPELEQNCWFDSPGSLPTQIQKRNFGDKSKILCESGMRSLHKIEKQ